MTFHPELVVFPKTWDRYWEAFEVDAVVVVDGKIDAQSGDPKVLVDAVRKHKKVFQTSTEDRSVPEYHRMAELVRNGRIGKVHTVEVMAPAGGAGGSMG
jgi:DNA polymerase III alpha subunit